MLKKWIISKKFLLKQRGINNVKSFNVIFNGKHALHTPVNLKVIIYTRHVKHVARQAFGILPAQSSIQLFEHPC